jgi:hypothetical protein
LWPRLAIGRGETGYRWIHEYFTAVAGGDPLPRHIVNSALSTTTRWRLGDDIAIPDRPELYEVLPGVYTCIQPDGNLTGWTNPADPTVR